MSSQVDKLHEHETENLVPNSEMKEITSGNTKNYQQEGLYIPYNMANVQNSKLLCRQRCIIIALILLILSSFIMSLVSLTMVCVLRNQVAKEITIYSTKMSSSSIETNVTTIYLTNEPTNIPTNIPTNKPTNTPTNISTNIPTNVPLYTYKRYVGDYKISSQTASHDNWLLCDGSFLDPRKYTKLFDVIQYLFGNKTSENEYVDGDDGYNHLLIRFALPDARDRVVGINGNQNNIGNKIGKENVTLTIDNIPSHSHLITHSDYNYWDQTRGISFGFQIVSYTPYRWRDNHQLNTSEVGNGSGFDLYQPTIFAGNLFIYAGNE